MESRRFADTICGVVHQPRQFSYSKTAAVRTQSKNWRTAVAIASIAREERWQEIAPDALFFHANYVAPSWRQSRVKVSQVGAHIFYRYFPNGFLFTLSSGRCRKDERRVLTVCVSSCTSWWCSDY